MTTIAERLRARIGYDLAHDTVAEAADALDAAEKALADIMEGHHGENRWVTFHSGALLYSVSAALAKLRGTK